MPLVGLAFRSCQEYSRPAREQTVETPHKFSYQTYNKNGFHVQSQELMAPQVIRVILGVVVVVAVGTTLTQQIRLHDVPRESDAPAQESPVEFVSSTATHVCTSVDAQAPRVHVCMI